MTRILQTTAFVTLTLGAGLPGGLVAQAPSSPGEVPFCAPDPAQRAFPCRGANMSVVTSNQELTARGGGVAPDWMRKQDRARSGLAPQAPATAGAQTPPGQVPDDQAAQSGTPGSQDAQGDAAASERATAEARERQERQAAEQERRRQERQAAEEERRRQEQQAAEEERRRQERAAAEDRERRERQAAEARAREEEQAARRAEKRAERRARRAAAAAAQDAEAPAEVVERTVTEESVRKSDEAFDTRIGSGNRAAAIDTGDDGLKDAGKALLFGLGALAVKQILDDGDEVVANSGDRLVVRRDGELSVLKDDDTLLRRPGDEMRTERFSDGSTRTVLTRPNGVEVVTVRAADGTVLRRKRIMPDGREFVLFDDTQEIEPVDTDRLAALRDTPRPGRSATPRDEADLRRALEAELYGSPDRRFALEQVRNIASLRELAPRIEVDQITFATGSAVIRPGEARELADLGRALQRELDARPDTVLLVEGHTDAVGDAGYNLALSDRRAESVALALTEYFDVPPENLVVQGYGERHLKVATQSASPANRRAVVRNITSLLR